MRLGEVNASSHPLSVYTEDKLAVASLGKLSSQKHKTSIKRK